MSKQVNNQMQPRRKKGRPQNARNVVPNDPPRITSSIKFRHTFRFKSILSTAPPATGQNIGTINLFQMLVFASTDSSTGVLIQGFKLRKITAWTPPNQLGNTVSLTWTQLQNSSIGVEPKITTDTGLGFNNIGHAQLIPPRGTAPATWQNIAPNGSTIVTSGVNFNVFASEGTVLDISGSFTLFFGVQAFLGPTSAAQLTPGLVYQSFLDQNLPDGTPNPAPVWQPIGLLPFKP